MNCPKCNYVMSDFDKECQRCASMEKKAEQSVGVAKPAQAYAPPTSMQPKKGFWYQISGSCPYCREDGNLQEFVKNGEQVPIWAVILIAIILFPIGLLVLLFNKPDEWHRHCSACGQTWRAM